MRRLSIPTAIAAILHVGSLVGLADESAPRKLAILVRGSVPKFVKSGEAIPLRITISNGLEWPIHYVTYSLKANAWNGETASVSLVDTYREGSANLFLAAPEVTPPELIAGFSSHQIEPGKSITIHTDARKWKLRDGWKPGRYTITVAVKHLQIDAYSTLRVISERVQFEIN